VNGAMELGMKTKFHCVEGQRAQSQKTPRWCRASKTELKEFQKIKSPKNSATTRLYILNATMKMMQRDFFFKKKIFLSKEVRVWKGKTWNSTFRMQYMTRENCYQPQARQELNPKMAILAAVVTMHGPYLFTTQL